MELTNEAPFLVGVFVGGSIVILMIYVQRAIGSVLRPRPLTDDELKKLYERMQVAKIRAGVSKLEGREGKDKIWN
jgi:peptidoglycan biosynthesis protein MviN/MurJ (putative lipid II flippase)